MEYKRSIENAMMVRTYDGESRDAMVLVHGFGAWAGSLAGIVAHHRFASYRKLIPDLPGHGLSAACLEGMSHEGLANLLAAWLRDRGEGPVVLIGHSMGGVVAQILAERYPSLVRVLINVEGNISRDDCTISGRVAGPSRQEFLATGFARLTDEIYRAGSNDRTLRDYFVSLSMADPDSLFTLAGELVALSEGEALAGRLAALPMPVRYIAGVPGGAGQRTLSLLENAGIDTVVISPAGHLPFNDQPDVFAAAIGEMIDAYDDRF